MNLENWNIEKWVFYEKFLQEFLALITYPYHIFTHFIFLAAILVAMNNQRKFVRPKNGRIIAGVAAGIANYFNINVTIVRIVWVLLLIPGGLPGLIPYLLMWVFMPSEDKSFTTSGSS